jgi:hypothetical protein
MPDSNGFTSWHVGVAAEAIAAALFARCAVDVSVQYGANQPEYNLIVSKGEQLLKVSVKGSQDGSWGLCQSYLERNSANYQSAIDRWLARHKPRTVLCFVQFKNVGLAEMPRVYIARPWEVAERLRATAKGRGDTILYEYHKWSAKAVGAGTEERLPETWAFTKARVEELLAEA